MVGQIRNTDSRSQYVQHHDVVNRLLSKVQLDGMHVHVITVVLDY